MIQFLFWTAAIHKVLSGIILARASKLDHIISSPQATS
uniref:Uncharacterized protein n=1 Tax=Anguilla anguilla TaxID=7936 RepID=A0A0E9V8Z5_ANGAN